MWCFEYPDLDIDIKNYFYQIFTTCSAQIGRKTKSAQDLLKFGTFDISNMPISILMSKMIFIKSLQPVTPKLTPNWKCSGFTEIWHMWYFEYRDLDFDVKNYFLSNIYQLLLPNWSQTEKCSEFIEIWTSWYFKYADLSFDVNNDFY